MSSEESTSTGATASEADRAVANREPMTTTSSIGAALSASSCPSASATGKASSKAAVRVNVWLCIGDLAVAAGSGLYFVPRIVATFSGPLLAAAGAPK